MFGGRRDDQRAVLVSAAEPISENEGAGEDLNLNDGQGMSYHEMLEYAKRKKWMFLFAGTGIVLLLGVIIGTIVATVSSSSAPVINPTTPIPTSPTTTPSSTTTTSSTTPSTTTSSTTTTPTTTTTSTTTTPSTTTTSTTTTPKTTTSTSTTTSAPPPGPAIPTKQPLPPNPEGLPATTLIQQVFYPTQFEYIEMNCTQRHPPTFKYLLTIERVGNFTGESTEKVLAKTAASQAAATSMFHIHYANKPPLPPLPCDDHTGATVSANQ